MNANCDCKLAGTRVDPVSIGVVDVASFYSATAHTTTYVQCYRRLNNLINLGELNSCCCQLGKISPKLSQVVIFGVEVDQF